MPTLDRITRLYITRLSVACRFVSSCLAAHAGEKAVQPSLAALQAACAPDAVLAGADKPDIVLLAREPLGEDTAPLLR